MLMLMMLLLLLMLMMMMINMMLIGFRRGLTLGHSQERWVRFRYGFGSMFTFRVRV